MAHSLEVRAPLLDTRVVELASLYDKRIGHETWEAFRQASANAPDQLSAKVAARFISILSQPAQLVLSGVTA